jgi:predicted metal-dependent phosphoesterase TrpH
MIEKRSDRLRSFSADLHIHSALSPCAEDKMRPLEVLNKIISLGIDVFSITDHNSVFNNLAFSVFAKERKILFVPGIEVQSSEEIHLLGYFPEVHMLERFFLVSVKTGVMKGMKNDPKRFGRQVKINTKGEVIGEEEEMLSMPLDLSLDELVNSIHLHGGIAVAAHIDRGFSVISHLGFIPATLKLDAVEVSDVNKIEDIRSNYLADREINVISSSDSHYLDMMKKPKMKLWLDNSDAKSCLNCLKGDGVGRITLRPPQKGIPDMKKMKPGKVNNVTLVKDWKTIYDRP